MEYYVEEAPTVINLRLLFRKYESVSNMMMLLSICKKCSINK